MKIEYLYLDDSYKKILQDYKIEDYNEIRKGDIYIFYFEEKENDENAANHLSLKDHMLCKALDSKKCYKLIDEASEYYNKTLYPLCNKYERSLRYVLCLASMSNHEQKALDKCRQFEKLNLNDIYNYFFTDSELNQKIKDIIKDRNLSRNDIIKLYFLPEHTMWGKLFNDKYDVIGKDFVDIKNYRNNVMHAKSMDYITFSNAKKKLQDSISILEDITEKLLAGSIVIENDSTKELANMIKEIDNMDCSDDEKGDILTRKILDKIHSELDAQHKLI
jgi:hypothetical protein